MDTGNYMANQMSDIIEHSEHLREEALEEVRIDIQDYIERMNYTWDAKDIMKEYAAKYKKGYYVRSPTCKEIILRFESALAHVL